MFGYLNLNDPRDIANNEAQEANNCRVDRGKLEFKSWSTDPTGRRDITLSSALIGDGIRYYINQTFPNGGSVLRDGLSKTGDYPGIPDVVGAPIPTAVAGTGLLPPGTYEYAFAVFDDVFQELGAVATAEVTIGAGQDVEITDFPALSDAVWDTKNPVWLVYRRPLGASEFYQLPNPCTRILPGTASVTDIIGESDLLANSPGILEETDNVAVGGLGLGFDVTQMLVFRERLFIIVGSEVWFTKPGMHSITQSDWFFSFDAPGTSLEIKDESLYIFTENRVFVLYGDDEDSFTPREVSTQRGSVDFATNLVGPMVVFGERRPEDQTVTIEAPPTSGEIQVLSSVQAVVGNAPQNISEKITGMLPVYPYVYDNALGTDVNPAFEASVIENRFAVFKHVQPPNSFTFADLAALLAALRTIRYLVFDQISQGFLTGDTGSTFQYRTKEFGELGKLSQFRAGYVVAEGQFDLEIYGDGKLLTSHSFNLATQTRQRFTVKPQRCNTFSFRFVGQSNAIIYEYGRLE